MIFDSTGIPGSLPPNQLKSTLKAAGIDLDKIAASLDDAAVAALGFGATAADMASRLAAVAAAAGVGGLVCSPREVRSLRALYPKLVLCTPGIRPAGSDAGDQARTETPEEAIRAGADLLVVGRPLHAAKDPATAARTLERAVASALGERARR